MNNTFSVQQTSQTGNVYSNLILRQQKLDLIARFIEIKSMYRKLTQKEIAKELGYSTWCLQRCRQDIKMLSPYRIPPDRNRIK